MQSSSLELVKDRGVGGAISVTNQQSKARKRYADNKVQTDRTINSTERVRYLGNSSSGQNINIEIKNTRG